MDHTHKGATMHSHEESLYKHAKQPPYVENIYIETTVYPHAEHLYKDSTRPPHKENLFSNTILAPHIKHIYIKMLQFHLMQSIYIQFLDENGT